MPPTPPSSVRRAPLMLLDPYSDRIIICAQAGGVAAGPAPHPVPGAARGPSIALRVLQLALLSSVAVVVGFMLIILQATE
jgi:hypothetical protein